MKERQRRKGTQGTQATPKTEEHKDRAGVLKGACAEALARVTEWGEHHPKPTLAFGADAEVVYANPAAQAWLQEGGRSDWASVLPAETNVAVRMGLAAAQAKGPLEQELGGQVYAWTFYPVPAWGLVMGQIEDITGPKNLTAQLRHSQRLEAVGRLAAGVAHDFNNLLTVLQGHLGLLETAGTTNALLQDSLQQMVRATERGRLLTSQLMVFSRKAPSQPVLLDLNEVLTHLSTLFHRMLGEDINYQFAYAPELPRISADRGQIEQMVMILALNARDAMPRGGQLMLGTTVVDVDSAPVSRHPQARPGRFVCLSVVDSGCGMDHVVQSRLFEPFFTTKEFGKGTGLGLAVVQQMVQAHQGWIEVQSMVGQGSTFRLYFPAVETVVAATLPSLAAGSPRGGGETILVVEDEPPVRWVFRQILERQGYQVIEAASGIEALAVWHQNHESIALMLVDMVMPVGLSGQELAERFRAHKPNLKVLFTSGYTAHAASRDLPLSEGIDFLHKPFDAQTLALTVRNALDRGSY